MMIFDSGLLFGPPYICYTTCGIICITLAQTELHCYRTHPERSQSRIIAPRDHRIYAHRLYNYVLCMHGVSENTRFKQIARYVAETFTTTLSVS